MLPPLLCTRGAKRYVQISRIAACLFAFAIGGCSNTATPRAGLHATARPPSHPRVIGRVENTAPNHVLTFAWIEAKDHVSPTLAAPYLDWAEVQGADANAFSAAGIKTVLYTNPNRTYPGQPMYTQDESTFAHDCSGNRITILNKPGPTYQMDPTSPHLAQLWQNWVTWATNGNHYDAIFDDSADSVHNTSALPCEFNQIFWSAASQRMNASLGKTIIYNGLGTLDNVTKPPPAIQLNPSVFGGMLEGCYGNVTLNNPVPKKAVWYNFETTELTMSAQQKPFVCRGLSQPPAQQAYNLRMYMYSSFLLTYDPSSSIVSEKFTTPSNLSVFPEETFVALNPLVPAPGTVATLQTSQWTYGRQYADCYLWGLPVGSCAAAVNADDASVPHPFPWSGVYKHTLVLVGAGILDGGIAIVYGPPPPAMIPGASAVIAIQ